MSSQCQKKCRKGNNRTATKLVTPRAPSSQRTSMTCSVRLVHHQVVGEKIAVRRVRFPRSGIGWKWQGKRRCPRLFVEVHAAGVEDAHDKNEPHVAQLVQRLGNTPRARASNWKRMERKWTRCAARGLQRKLACHGNATPVASAGWCGAGHSRTRGYKLPLSRGLRVGRECVPSAFAASEFEVHPLLVVPGLVRGHQADGSRNNVEGTVTNDEPLILGFRLHNESAAPATCCRGACRQCPTTLRRRK